MNISGKTLWLVCITTLVIGLGVLWVLEDPYVKSQYHRTHAVAIIELQWPDGTDYCEIQDKLVYNRAFAFIFEHKPRKSLFAWDRVYPRVDWRTGEIKNSTRVSSYFIDRPATVIVWVRYYKTTVEGEGLKLEVDVMVDAIRYEHIITPMSKSSGG